MTGAWSVNSGLLNLAVTARGTEVGPDAASTRGLLAQALIDFDAAFNYEATAAPPTLFDDLDTKRGERDTAVTDFNTAVGNLATEQGKLNGFIGALAVAKAAVVADDL